MTNPDIPISRAASRHGPLAIRLSLGIVLFWFGVLKFVPGLSPAESLMIRTVEALTFGVLVGDTARLFVAAVETLIGVALLTGRMPHTALAALALQMAGTFAPLLLFPGEMWRHPFVPSLEGQYIVKNIVLVSAAFALAATVLTRLPEGVPVES
ncbi:DoxX family protein [Actinoplanes sp. NEAU-A12]|uniref:DoxX family protein n=1 Tax=Actinoplanes sandaracinus TaxID=3045177 RepID=A0ABT6WKZ9_9ACTN|nr:DoxX family protein [Actinoplanes sandaracinus]MDI6100401.1 DoxX family protein [Actinoplanes sandaracinus]